MSVNDLIEIASRHGTDKWNGHWYAKPYAENLGYLREDNIQLLEIGIGGYDNEAEGGKSLRAWKEYFPNAEIIGLDYYNKKILEEDRIRIYQGSQADPLTIAKLRMDFPGGFDVIIDDGSHRSEHVIASLVMMWQYVKPEGWYIIEDLQTSYWPMYGGSLNNRNSPLTSMGFLQSLVDGLNWSEIHQPGYQPSAFEREIVSINFYHNMAFLRKGNNMMLSTEVVGNRIKGV